jgi:UrcA family protein
MSKFLRVAAVAIGAGLTLHSSAAAAETMPWNGRSLTSRTIRYTEAELQTPDGAKALAFRIRQAAMDVCGGESLVLRTRASFYRCTNAAAERAAAGLNAPLVREALGLSADRMARR